MPEAAAWTRRSGLAEAGCTPGAAGLGTSGKACPRRTTPGSWLTEYQLPPYGLTPTRSRAVWSHLKRSLANLAKRNIGQLTTRPRAGPRLADR